MKKLRLLICAILPAVCLTVGAGAYDRTAPAKAPEDAAVLQSADVIIEFGTVTIPENAVAFAAVYDPEGRMLYLAAPVLSDGRVKLAVPDAVYAKMDTARLFRLDGMSFAPVGSAVTKTKFDRSDIETPLY